MVNKHDDCNLCIGVIKEIFGQKSREKYGTEDC